MLSELSNVRNDFVLLEQGRANLTKKHETPKVDTIRQMTCLLYGLHLALATSTVYEPFLL